jgi:hypothetical protein
MVMIKMENYFSTIFRFKVYFSALNTKEEIAQGTISSFLWCCLNTLLVFDKSKIGIMI